MKVKASILQLLVTEDKSKNIQNAKSHIEKATSKGAQLIVLPEIWNSPYSNASFPKYAEDISGGKSESYDMVREAAKNHKVVIVGGSIPEREDDKLYNSCCIFDETGLIGKYRKNHLFDIDIPGKITFKESDTLTQGDNLTLLDTKFGKIAIMICYDIRFPALAQVYGQRGAQIMIMPGSFNMTTGPQHWELLFRARAVDSQCFFLGCSPARNVDSGYHSWGHSIAVSPWAEILGQLDAEQDILDVELDLSQIDERRTNMPIAKQLRHDLYEIVDKGK